MSLDKLSGVERAAILLICLGEDIAAEVLKEMTDEEIFKITRAMAKIEHIPEDIRQRVLEDFELSRESYAGMVVRGNEFAKKAISRAGDKERVETLLKRFASGTEGKPLETISKMQPAMVAGLLEREHPQTVALVLSTQTSEHASAIIANLPEDKQADVIYRIATLEMVSPDVINRIEDALNKELGIVAEHEQRQVGGIDKVVEILDHMENNLDADILENIEEMDPEMVEEIRKQMFTFEDLSNLDGRSLQMILREVNNDTLTMALKTASEELKEKIFANMSARAADMIRDDLEAMGPVRLSEVEAMQQAIVKIAMKLEEEGKLVLGKGGGDELV
ncbi:flagellar motor switch protein FliG [Desulfolithobacter dissulfuricans]|uniref:Flagellar motor switch protein FliG n=1 Tax=Desulfolithobacter dissulfuricans TaxID=2795293 RepID=A0A915U0I7_9BACT|nr:flagellar motor switch protein FliG [Desulfolithobacter dissulfuricans]BCO08550.1 flagellar motor switch protein FliG [Desulfolithobacter dissulfuricans]